MISKKNLLLSVSLIFILIGTVNSNSIEPDIFVQSTVNRASEALNNIFSKEEKIKKLKTIAKETVDIRGIGFIHLVNIEKHCQRIR
jgi:phospholipid transport system substrate-binding protein